ncbi:MAG: protease family protein [Chloroflexota bacterium]|jgi:membrane protease YdiL (CAAX protease family)|nr:protease family protein [Chloroflexota bacterium]
MAGVAARTVRWGDVALFVLVAYGLSWLVWVGLKPVFPLAIRTFLAMFGPMFSAIAVIRVRRGNNLRRQWRMTRRRVLNNLVASGLAAATIAIVVVVGLALSLASGDLTFNGGSGENLFQEFSIPLALFIYWITAFGEEYGWRGFLQPTLAPLGGARTGILTAVIFAGWHIPAILFDGFDYPRHHILGIFDMLVFAVPFTIVLAWLRSATGTISGPAAAHATLNMCAGLLYANTNRTTAIIAAPVGLFGMVAFAMMAVGLLLSGRLWARVDLLAQPVENLSSAA